ncbi:MAG TPA: NUDIX domain-containing protein [Candidatus Obscuribacterales bacterium]
MNRRTQYLLPAVACTAISLFVVDRETALLGAFASLAIGTICGGTYFGGFQRAWRYPFSFVSTGLGLIALALILGIFVPSSMAALVSFPILGLVAMFSYAQYGGKFNLAIINGPAATPGFEKLSTTCRDKEVNVITLKASERNVPVSVIDGSFVFVAGAMSPAELKAVCHNLRHRGLSPIIIRDAIADHPGLHEALVELNEESFQVTVSGAVRSLLSAAQLKVYAFAKADCTTTTAVFLKNSRKVLVIKRDRDPFKDQDSLPGGFLNVHLEGVPGCAAREVMEECFVNKDAKPGEPKFTYQVNAADMVLVDVRSQPDRDAREHVVDHGYLWVVPDELEAEVLSRVSAGDDAKPGSARFADLDAVLSNPLAFDHSEFLIQAATRAGLVQPLA